VKLAAAKILLLPQKELNMTRSASKFILAAFAVVATGSMLSACGNDSGGAGPTSQNSVAQLYTQSNEEANVVVQMARNSDGTLTVTHRYFTGGHGTNGVKLGDATVQSVPDSLVSQHPIIITPDKKRLITVNAGDNTVSVFSIDQTSGNLTLKKVNETAGVYPTSLAYSKGFLYVTFQGGSQQLQAYSENSDGSLTIIGAYAVPRNGAKAVSPTQVVVSPDGAYLVVSAGVGADEAVSYPINADGTLGTAVSNTTGVVSPFAGEFVTSSLYLSTSIANKALASYSAANGVLTPIGLPLTSGNGGPCWLSVTPNGKYAYVGNGSGPISSYAVSAGGALALLHATAAADSVKVSGDSWISADGKYLYAAYLADGFVLAYAINSDGSLTKIGAPAAIGTVTGISMQGLVGL
jgi:6-phosphogluconolactonase